ncbi:MAG TPA: hypothetical protein VN285_02945 [Candidatus Deferrimicrobium sp.]|nr:hypothetical protein [Candidatus Deferrimicrobium sp.]
MSDLKKFDCTMFSLRKVERESSGRQHSIFGCARGCGCRDADYPAITVLNNKIMWGIVLSVFGAAQLLVRRVFSRSPTALLWIVVTYS